MTDRDDPLAELPRELEPPALLKGQVRQTLRAQGLVVPSRRSVLGRAALLAASVGMILTAGVIIGRGTAPVPPAAQMTPAPPARDPRPQFVLLLYEDSSFTGGQSGALVAEYSAWGDSIARQGLLVTAGKLADGGSVVLEGARSGVNLEAGDVASAAGSVTGYFIVRAADEAQALAIAGSMPHLRYGGRIALRPIERARRAGA